MMASPTSNMRPVYASQVSQQPPMSHHRARPTPSRSQHRLLHQHCQPSAWSLRYQSVRLRSTCQHAMCSSRTTQVRTRQHRHRDHAYLFDPRTNSLLSWCCHSVYSQPTEIEVHTRPSIRGVASEIMSEVTGGHLGHKQGASGSSGIPSATGGSSDPSLSTGKY